MSLNKTLLYDTAADVLDSVATRLAAQGITVPTRQYVHAGEVAFDCCDQLVVTVVQLDHAMPGEQATILQCAPPRHANIDVWLTRCVPVSKDNGDPPTAAELEASAAEVLTDMWSLAYVLWEGYQAHDWGGTCSSVILNAIEAVGPEGGCGGSHAAIDLLII